VHIKATYNVQYELRVTAVAPNRVYAPQETGPIIIGKVIDDNYLK